MSSAYVVGGTVQQERASVPDSGKRLDTGQWVSGLPVASAAVQQACGWYTVTDVAKPADTPTTTNDRSLTVVGGVPTVTWTQRAKTAAEQTADTANTNQASVVTNLNQDMVAMQAIIDATNATINANPAQYIKDIARMNRRLGRRALSDYTGST